MYMLRCFLFALLVLAVSSCTTTYYFVRHAEKACEDCLTCGLQIPDGSNRAMALADSMDNKGVDNIFASQCVRTQETAIPLSDRINKQIDIYQTEDLEEFIAVLKGYTDNRSILIVGHSNQVPVMIESIANRQVTIDSEDFDNLFIIRKRRFLTTTIQFESKTYGVPTP